MNKKNVFKYIAALIVCFLLGCGAALILYAVDSREIAPLEGGKTLAVYGFSLDAPQDAVLLDHTQDSLLQGENAAYAGSIQCEWGGMYIFCYDNDAGDSIGDYSEQELVRYYMNAGAAQVRIREFGGRRFICYRASVLTEEGEQFWDTYETWDKDLQITIETQIDPIHALPMMATIDFTDTDE